MKALLKVALVSVLGLVSQLALATGSNASGKTTCYILKNNKLAKKAPCKYDGLFYSSIGYSETSYGFTVKGYGEISTEVSSAAKTDKNGDFLNDPDGSISMEKPVIAVNNKPATPHFRNKTNFKIISDSVTEKLIKRNKVGNLLSCMQQKDSKLEVCIPVKDGILNGEY